MLLIIGNRKLDLLFHIRIIKQNLKINMRLFNLKNIVFRKQLRKFNN